MTQADTQELFENKSRLTSYDANGNVTSTTDAKGQTTTLAYDARDRKVSQTDRLAGVTTWGYDANGNLLSLCDPDNQAAGKATLWTYDDCNRKLTETYPDHAPTATPPVNDQKTFTYDLAGRPAVFTDQQGDTVTHAFDAANRLLSRAYHSASGARPDDTDTLTYDDAGRLLAAQSGRYNNSVTMAYGDGAGRLTSESLTVNFTQARTYTVQSLYDEAGHRTQITYPGNAVVKRSYNSRDLLEEIKYSDNMVASFTYDDAGRRETRTLGDTPGTVTRWTYGRQDNLVTAIKAPSDTGSVTQSVYDYDANKNKTKEQIAEPAGMAKYGFGTNTAAGYDNENRLTSWTRDAQGGAQSWRLTAAGDWDYFTDGINGDGIEHKRTHTPVHELKEIAAGTTLVYDAKGNLTTNSNAQVYAWDFNNRMRSATVGGNTHEYTYDALGRRVSKSVVTTNPTGQQTTAVTVFVCVTQPIEHSPFAGQEVAEYVGGAAPSTPSQKYVYGAYVDEPVLLAVGAGTSETKYYYHQNNLYSVAALTNQAGTVVERYAYTAYGKPLFCDPNGNTLTDQQKSGVGNPFLYTGRRLDPETGLYYYRARYYDAGLGRFIGRDPIGYNGDIDLYAYVNDNPANAIDPSGRAPDEWDGAHGYTKCDVKAGKLIVAIDPSQPWARKACTRLHEGIHVIDYGSCCAKAIMAYKATNDPARKKRIEKAMEDWISGNRWVFECRAHTVSALCLKALLRCIPGDCDCEEMIKDEENLRFQSCFRSSFQKDETTPCPDFTKDPIPVAPIPGDDW